MPSTYSSLLRLELMQTGEKSATWGDITNTNIGTLLEKGIAGTATINVTAGNVTLTALNGADDEARCLIISVTGTPGVSRNIVAPSTSKSYVVLNGSNAAIVFKGAATTGVTLSAGQKSWLAWNGSDFVVIGVPLDSPTFTGTTTVSNLTATGAVSSATVASSGNATVGGTLGVTGNTTVGGTLGVTGNTTVSNVTASGAVSAATLASSGNTTVGGTLGVTGNATVGGTFGATGNTTVGGTLGVTGTSTLSGSVTAGGTLAPGVYGMRVGSTTGDRLRIVSLAAGNGALIDVSDAGETVATRPLTLGTASAPVYLGSTNQFTKDASGNVAIGVSSTGNRLRVLSSDAAYVTKIENTRGDPTGYGLWVDTRWNVASNIVARFSTNSGVNEILNLYGDTSAVFSGSVGFGAAPTAGYRADVSGTVRSTGGEATTGYGFRVLNSTQNGGGHITAGAGVNGGITIGGDSGTIRFSANGSTVGIADSGGLSGYTATNQLGLTLVFRAAPTGTNGGALNFYNWNNGGTDINLARVYCQTTSGAVGNEAADLYFYTKPAGGALTSRLRIQDTGQVDIQAGSGNLRIGGSITRFESAEQTCPTTSASTASVAHGGPRVPDQVQMLLRCKTAEAGYSVGDEVAVNVFNSGGDKTFSVWANSTNVGMVWRSDTNAAPYVGHKTTAVATNITAANWRLVFKCLWL
jgi:hypothetical protein